MVHLALKSLDDPLEDRADIIRKAGRMLIAAAGELETMSLDGESNLGNPYRMTPQVPRAPLKIESTAFPPGGIIENLWKEAESRSEPPRSASKPKTIISAIAIHQFINERCEIAKNSSVSSEIMHEQWMEWAANEDIPFVDAIPLAKLIHQVYPSVGLIGATSMIQGLTMKRMKVATDLIGEPPIEENVPLGNWQQYRDNGGSAP